METKRNHQLLLLLILCSLLFSQTAAWLPLGDPAAEGNDVLEDLGPVKRQSDMVFTDRYMRLLKEQKKRKYLKSLLEGASSEPVRESSAPKEETERK